MLEDSRHTSEMCAVTLTAFGVFLKALSIPFIAIEALIGVDQGKSRGRRNKKRDRGGRTEEG